MLNQLKQNLLILYREYYDARSILHSTSPEAVFILRLKAERGELAALGAYAGLLNFTLERMHEFHSNYIDGLIEGFLYKREIDWTASAHQEALNDLRSKYKEKITRHDARFKELEKANEDLNGRYEAALNERAK